MLGKAYFSILFTALALTACSKNPIHYNNDSRDGVDFSNYSSYSWHAPNQYNHESNAYIENKDVDLKIRNGIEVTLAKKGYKKTDEANADFLVNYSITTVDDVDVSAYNNYSNNDTSWHYGTSIGSPYAYSRIGYRDFKPETEIEITHFSEGTFVLDIVGAKSKKLEWRGSAQGRMEKDTLTPADRDNVISDVLHNVMRSIPSTKH